MCYLKKFKIINKKIFYNTDRKVYVQFINHSLEKSNIDDLIDEIISTLKSEKYNKVYIVKEFSLISKRFKIFKELGVREIFDASVLVPIDIEYDIKKQLNSNKTINKFHL